jgi:hypothetical protein
MFVKDIACLRSDTEKRIQGNGHIGDYETVRPVIDCAILMKDRLTAKSHVQPLYCTCTWKKSFRKWVSLSLVVMSVRRTLAYAAVSTT